MPFDPNLPQENTLVDAAQMRAQLNGLKALIDALQGVSAAQVDAVATLPPGNPASVSVTLTGSTLHFTFDIPQGPEGAQGAQGSSGQDGAPGGTGPQGPPGEVSQTDLNNAVLNALSASSNNSNSVSTLAMGISDPPSQGEVQAIANKLDELINALRR